jgi:hypothetical protein
VKDYLIAMLSGIVLILFTLHFADLIDGTTRKQHKEQFQDTRTYIRTLVDTVDIEGQPMLRYTVAHIENGLTFQFLDTIAVPMDSIKKPFKQYRLQETYIY